MTTNRILRSATYLLFVLFATAGIYFQLEYSFLGAVQLTIYAGGIHYPVRVLDIAHHGRQKQGEQVEEQQDVCRANHALAGAAICVYITLMHSFGPSRFVGGEINQKVIGTALMGTEKYQYLLPFEVISVLLLTCIIGGSHDKQKKR